MTNTVYSTKAGGESTSAKTFEDTDIHTLASLDKTKIKPTKAEALADPAGDIYVDGSRIGDVGSVVIKDRKLMSHDGILVAILNINTLTRKLLIKPNVTARGFVMVNENQELMNKIENKIADIVNDNLSKSIYSYTDLKNQIIFELLPFINELTGRRPIILPVIMEVNQS
jgi:ribonuclease J